MNVLFWTHALLDLGTEEAAPVGLGWTSGECFTSPKQKFFFRFSPFDYLNQKYVGFELQRRQFSDLWMTFARFICRMEYAMA